MPKTFSFVLSDYLEYASATTISHHSVNMFPCVSSLLDSVFLQERNQNIFVFEFFLLNTLPDTKWGGRRELEERMLMLASNKLLCIQIICWYISSIGQSPISFIRQKKSK